ncbi:MAG: class I SAM-dependent methyltransferase [Proteobacteria bacterium]|nr:class I SAM-dependent methyltransferase [Pseudomonadota bacterium]
MSKKRKLNVDDAYALETPADNIRLYADWAETYDRDFVAGEGFEYHLRVAEIMLRHASQINGAVLDVGCGTGNVGVVLRNGGVEFVDGIDISPEMLAECGNKKAKDESPVYRNLIKADLTRTLDIEDKQYAGLVSAGTFTHGHLGPDTLDELWRIAAPGALCVLGINSKYYASMGFGEKLSAAVDNGTITKPELTEINMYAAQADDPEHAEDKALVVICQII